MKPRPTMLLGIAILLTAIPLFGHHSFATEWDGNKPVTLTGAVMRLDLMNPHCWLYLNVKEANGTTTSWGVELGPVAEMHRQGWDKTSVNPGSTITVEGFLAKKGSNMASAHLVKLASGKIIFTSAKE